MSKETTTASDKRFVRLMRQISRKSRETHRSQQRANKKLIQRFLANAN